MAMNLRNYSFKIWLLLNKTTKRDNVYSLNFLDSHGWREIINTNILFSNSQIGIIWIVFCIIYI